MLRMNVQICDDSSRQMQIFIPAAWYTIAVDDVTLFTGSVLDDGCPWHLCTCTLKTDENHQVL